MQPSKAGRQLFHCCTQVFFCFSIRSKTQLLIKGAKLFGSEQLANPSNRPNVSLPVYFRKWF
jgi:hypothetical protein